MRFTHLIVFPVAALAAVNGRCTGPEATDSWGSAGICIQESECRSRGGTYKSGACPYDGNSIKCCLIGAGPSSRSPCGVTSWCTWTSNSCPGQFLSGYCPGGDNYRCCKR